MGRAWQVFVAPGNEIEPLPIPASPWHDERWVRIPEEHWELMLDFAEPRSYDQVEKLRSFLSAASDNEDYYIYASAEELASLIKWMEELEQAIMAAPTLVPEATEEIPDEYSNEEHVRMLRAVRAVWREAIYLEKHCQYWLE